VDASRFEQVFHHSPFPMTLVTLDGIYVDVNEAWCAFTGRTLDEVVGRSVLELCPPEDRHTLSAQMHDALQSGVWPQGERRFVRPDGTEVWARRSVLRLPGSDGQPDLVLTQLQEITQARQVEAKVAENLRVWQSFVDVAPVAVFRISPDGSAQSMTQRWEELTGQRAEAALGFGWSEVVHPDDRSGLFAAGLMAFGTGSELHHVYRIRHRDGSVRWLDVHMGPVLDAGGNVLELIGSASDVTDLKEAQDRLAHLADHDDLTGLANRRSFREHVNAALARSERAGTVIAVVFCDLDGFKQINDHAGHDVGDVVLADVARRLAAAIRVGDVAARIGGDEFVVLCEPVGSLAEALAVADRLSAAARISVPAGTEVVDLGVSIGVALSRPGMTADALVAEADSAMYRAKAAGPNSVHVYEPRAA
jgi:diguanylate cyclase (GGDEF)-like protein/PAS domain S-box-containing protein